MKIIKQTIEDGQPAYIADLGDGPEIYTEEQLRQIKREQIFEVFGFIGCSIIMTLIFVGLILIL